MNVVRSRKGIQSVAKNDIDLKMYQWKIKLAGYKEGQCENFLKSFGYECGKVAKGDT